MKPFLVLPPSQLSRALSPSLLSLYSTTTTPFPSSPPPSGPVAPEPKPSVSNRLRSLIRTQGWSALAIYLILSLADFSLTFLLIYAVGAERVREAEDWTLEALGWRRKDGEMGSVRRAVEGWNPRKHEKEKERDVVARVEEGEQSGYGAIATTAVLAYAIHKTLLLPVRLGMTIAITPRIVRALQGWG